MRIALSILIAVIAVVAVQAITGIHDAWLTILIALIAGFTIRKKRAPR